jgi:hypothetical protein
VDDFMKMDMLVETGAPDVSTTFKSPYFGRNNCKPHARELDDE